MFTLTLRATFLHTLDKIGNKEIGLLFPGSSKSPSFKIGDTSRIQVLVVKEEFIIAAIEGIIIITGTKSLMTRVGILSRPGPLFLNNDDTIFSTSEQ